jgi:SagB-type dehydrogenase family enzyme
VLSYHRRSKHHLHRYADGPGGLDWANQPDPFRTFAGAPTLDLPLLADAVTASYADLFVPGAVKPRRLALDTIAILFELSLGLSAWKEYRGTRWALRCNPSSGNLHPTEGYAVVPALPGLDIGVHHYVSRDHRLEQRCACETNWLPANTILVGLSSIPWREAWKYGIRAFRYCQHDVGHALAAVRFAAAALGWQARLLDRPGDEEIGALLGLDRETDFARGGPREYELPEALVLVGPAIREDLLGRLPKPGGKWSGTANRLSPNHVHWEVIDHVATATTKPLTDADTPFAPSALPPPATAAPVPAAAIIRQRRSALGFDGQTALDSTAFYRMLVRLLPRPEVPPWDLLSWPPVVHLAIIVHRINGLAPGLYFFERDPQQHEALQAECRPGFLWRRPEGCPDQLALYLLTEGDFRRIARQVSCAQDIAADGAFALGMVVEFSEMLRSRGPWWYRRLFWETGVVGQALYLEAEAAGLRSTGIGCYFDDAMHELLGLSGDRFQSLYHFTVGVPVEDVRLRTLAPYAHLGRPS